MSFLIHQCLLPTSWRLNHNRSKDQYYQRNNHSWSHPHTLFHLQTIFCPFQFSHLAQSLLRRITSDCNICIHLLLHRFCWSWTWALRQDNFDLRVHPLPTPSNTLLFLFLQRLHLPHLLLVLFPLEPRFSMVLQAKWASPYLTSNHLQLDHRIRFLIHWN